MMLFYKTTHVFINIFMPKSEESFKFTITNVMGCNKLQCSPFITHLIITQLGHVAQSVTCLATDSCLGIEFDPDPVSYFRGD